MITVIVEFKLPQPMSVDQARETFLSTAPKYRGMAGLIRKYYFLSEDGGKAGGIYQQYHVGRAAGKAADAAPARRRPRAWRCRPAGCR